MKITERQRQSLEAIAKYIKKNGIPPSISDLQKALGLKSRQPAVNLLNRLEKSGLIKRGSESTRSVILTENGLTIVGEMVQTKENESSKRINKDLVERLNDIDPYLAQCYISAWNTFDSSNIPSRLSGAAHHMRNIGYNLSGNHKSSQEERIQKLSQCIRESIASLGDLENLEVTITHFEAAYRKKNSELYIQKTTDPRGLKTVDHERSALVRLADLTHTLSKVSHNDSKIDEAVVEKLMSEYESVLLFVTQRQSTVLESIDGIISKNPSPELLEELGLFASFNLNARHYFFKIVNMVWFKFLLDQPSLPFTFLTATNELGGAMARLVKEDSTVIARALQRVPIKECNSYFVNDLSNILENLPEESRVSALNHLVEILFVSKHNHVDWYSLINLLQRKAILDSAPLREIAFMSIICRHILQCEGGGTDRENDVEEAARLLIKAEDKKASISLLLEGIYTLLNTEKYDGRYVFLFSMNRAENDQLGLNLVEQLLFTLIEGLKELLETTAPSERSSVWNSLNLEKYRSPLLLRVQLYLLRCYQSDLTQYVHDTLLLINLFEDPPKEWGELLADRYLSFSDEDKKHLREAIESCDSKYTPDQQHHLIAERYFWIKDSIDIQTLNPSVKVILETKDLSPKPLYESWSGPESPIDVPTLKLMQSDEILQSLYDYVPSGDGWFSSSREGLGRNLEQIVSADPQKHLSLLVKDAVLKLEPIYIAHIYRGYEKTIKEDGLVDIHALVEPLEVIFQYKSNVILSENFQKSDDDSNTWREALRSIGHFIQTILQKDALLSVEEQIIVWDFIDLMSRHRDPSKEYEKEYFKDIRDEMTLSLNTVRGVGITAVIYFFLYQKRNCQLKDIPIEIKKVLEAAASSNSANDAVVLGRYAPWIFHSDRAWFALIWKQVMQCNPEVALAAWKGYLISRVDPTIFEFLTPQYQESLERILHGKDTAKANFSVSESKSVPEHLVYAIAYGYPNGQQLVERVLSATGKHKNRFLANFLSFFGRAIFQRETDPNHLVDLEQIKKLIERIVTTSTSNDVKSSFGWCINLNALPISWLLEILQKVLTDTAGKIEAPHLVFKLLKESALSFPGKTLGVLFLFISGALRDTWVISGHKEEILTIIKTVESIKNLEDEVKKQIAKIKDYLLRQGYDDFRE